MSLGNLSLSKLNGHCAVVDSQSARSISVIFRLKLYKIRRLAKSLFPKYWHIALFKVKYGSCLSILCLSTRKEVKNTVFTWNFNFVTAGIPIQPDKRINLILLYLFLYFFFLTLLSMSIGFSVPPNHFGFLLLASSHIRLKSAFFLTVLWGHRVKFSNCCLCIPAQYHKEGSTVMTLRS